MKYLLVMNDAPYGNKKAYNALRLAMTLQKEFSEIEIKIFLISDAVFCALPNTNTPTGYYTGYYNIERMMRSVINKGGKIKVCGTCGQARGTDNITYIEGVEKSNMIEYTVECDKVINF